jgi:hypothetical protein
VNNNVSGVLCCLGEFIRMDCIGEIQKQRDWAIRTRLLNLGNSTHNRRSRNRAIIVVALTGGGQCEPRILRASNKNALSAPRATQQPVCLPPPNSCCCLKPARRLCNLSSPFIDVQASPTLLAFTHSPLTFSRSTPNDYDPRFAC